MGIWQTLLSRIWPRQTCKIDYRKKHMVNTELEKCTVSVILEEL